MIELVQRKFSKDEIVSHLSRDNIELKMNTDLINADLARLNHELERAVNKYDKKNLEYLIKRTKKLIDKINDSNTLELCSTYDSDNLFKSYPIQLIKEELYKIDDTNYIELGRNQRLIDISLKEIAELIAFEIMFRDLGDTHDSIEKILSDCGIVSSEESCIITDHFKDLDIASVYELSKYFSIEDTPYYSKECSVVKDYFNSKQFKTNKYRDVVSYSCRYAATIIGNSIMKRCSVSNKIDAYIIRVTDTSITLIINDKSTDINKLIDDITLRSFGRHFKIKVSISEY